MVCPFKKSSIVQPFQSVLDLVCFRYGELSPSTFPGKLIGGLCALCGIFILTLPIPIVVNSFASYYKNRLWRNEVAYKKRERAQKRKEMEVLMKDNLLNILTVPGTPIRWENSFMIHQLQTSVIVQFRRSFKHLYAAIETK